MEKKLIRIFENRGFSVIEEPEDDSITIRQYTPAGEDWNLYFNKWEDILEYELDPEEEFEMWIEAKMSGTRGVPCIPDLWKDQLWKQNIIEKLKKGLEKWKNGKKTIQS